MVKFEQIMPIAAPLVHSNKVNCMPNFTKYLSRLFFLFDLFLSLSFHIFSILLNLSNILVFSGFEKYLFNLIFVLRLSFAIVVSFCYFDEIISVMNYSNMDEYVIYWCFRLLRTIYHLS